MGGNATVDAGSNMAVGESGANAGDGDGRLTHPVPAAAGLGMLRCAARIPRSAVVEPD